jgi:hypothetical protein
MDIERATRTSRAVAGDARFDAWVREAAAEPERVLDELKAPA